MKEHCPDDDVLALHVEGVLEPLERAEIARHIIGCISCRHLVEALAAAQTRSRPSKVSSIFPASTWRWKPGRRVGRHVIQGALGRGGMGEVYEALDTELERTVAIKVARVADDGGRMLAEGRLLAQLVHDNVIRVFDVGTHDGAVYIVMEFAEGSSLRRWLASRSPTVVEVLALFRDIATGCAALHRHGLVHRDIKPDNVLVNAEGRGMLSDFGLATPNATGSGGTPGYIAPEVERGEASSAASDQFGLCVTFTEALRACPRGRVPRRARAVLERGRYPEPQGRFESMDALIEALTPSRTWWPALSLGGGVLVAAAFFAAFFARGVPPDETKLASVSPEASALRARLVTAADARAAGRTTQSARVARDVLARAYALDERSLIAASLAEAGLSSQWGATAMERLESAYWMALDTEQLTLALDCAIALVERLSRDSHDREAQRWLGHARTIVERMNGDTASEARLALVIALTHRRTLDIEGGLQSAQKGLALAERVEPVDEDLLIMAEASLGAAQLLAQQTEPGCKEMSRALEHQLEHRGEDHPRTAWILLDLSMCSSHRADLDENVAVTQRAVDIAERLGPSPLTAEANRMLVSSLTAAGRYEEAFPVAERVETLYDALFPGDAGRRYEIYSIQSRIAQARARYDEANRWAEKSLLLANRTFGGRSKQVTIATAALAEIAIEEGRHERALRLLKDLLSLFEEHSGPGTPGNGIMLVKMGNAAFALGREEEAAEYFDRTLSIDTFDDARGGALLGKARLEDDRAERKRLALAAIEAYAGYESEARALIDAAAG